MSDQAAFREALTPAECLELLAAHRVGRLAFTDRALPSISAMSYALLGTQVLLRVESEAQGSLLDGQIVAFAVDDLDQHSGAGWSVVIRGLARLVRAPGDLLFTDTELIRPDPGPRVCLLQGEISGRRSVAVA